MRGQVPVRYVKVEDLLALLDHAQNTWWKALITLAYTSNGRRDELLNLTWADVDFARGSVCFSPKDASEQLLAWDDRCDLERGVVRRVVVIPFVRRYSLILFMR